MDPAVAIRLNQSDENPFYSAELASKLGETARNYVDSGLATLNYFIPDFDAANDLCEMYAPVLTAADYSNLDRTAAINFRHPLSFTELMTLTSAVAQTLFGGEQARTVDARKDEDEEAADAINGLLAWNDDKTSIFMQGFLWTWNAIVWNRGVWHEGTGQDCDVQPEKVEEQDITKPKVPGPDGEMVYQTRTRWRKKRVYSGYWNRLDLVSPYDFISDPTLPTTRMQEWRYAGHRVMIPWYELQRRSKLDPSEDDYVLPKVVDKLKAQKGSTTSPNVAQMNAAAPNTTRTFYERQLLGGSLGGIATNVSGGMLQGTDAVNKDDGGTVECFVLYIRASPKSLGLYEDDETEIIRLLISNMRDVLSVNIMPNLHDEFPYCVGEGALNGARQFSPGWGLKLKPCQDRVDDLNLTHARAQKRMGNILLIDDTKCDVSNLLSPDKNGLMVFRKEAGQGAPAEEVVYQIPLKDTTERYPEEMAMWEKTAENLTGAHSFIQGETEDPSQTLGQFNAVKQMAFGRISSIARNLSELALVPQTRRFVMNFKQFLNEPVTVRILGDKNILDPEGDQNKFRLVQAADIQCEFDVKPHDGSLPGADSTVIAAASRVLEAYSNNPALAEAFNKTVPGAIDLVKTLKVMLKKSGLPLGELTVSKDQAARNVQSIQAGLGQPPDPNAPPGAAPVPAGPIPIQGAPGAIPTIPSAEPPTGGIISQ